MPKLNDATREEVRARRISTEEMVRLQLDRINTLRSDVRNPDRVPAWSEANEALADLLIPWAKDDKEFLEAWQNRGVATLNVKGRIIPVPTARDCREAQQILMGLLDRSGLLVKRRTISGPGQRQTTEPEPLLEM